MFKKIMWILTSLLIVALLLIIALDVYCGIIGTFEIYDVDISQEATPLEFQSSLTASLRKVEDRLYITDITDEENRRRFLLKNGEIVILFDDTQYAEEFMQEDDMDSYEAFLSMSGEVAQYNLVRGVLSFRGKKVADNVWDYYVTDDGTLHYVVAEEGYTYVDSSTGYKIPFLLEGEYRKMKIGNDLLCIAEQAGLTKRIHIFNRKTGQKLYTVSDGESPTIVENKVIYITQNGIGTYDTEQQSEKSCLIDDVYDIQSFDSEYVYYMTDNMDVGRIKLTSMNDELILKSHLDNTMIQVYLKILTKLNA